MKTSRWTGWWPGLAAALLGAATVLGSLGCSHSCEDTFTCQVLDIGAPSCPEDPADAGGGDIPAECGIWVSASLGDDANDGSPEAPVATLGQAVAKAATGPRRVYACAEVFGEPITWPAGVALHGGFYCADHDWRHAGSDGVRTTLAPPPDQIPITLVGDGRPARKGRRRRLHRRRRHGRRAGGPRLRR